jgi:chemotaxis methyl-accepting protein methylase
MQVPDEWPEGQFDLIVLSEVLYFLSPDDVARCVRHVVGTLLPGGVVVLVNWLGQSDDPVSGDEAADSFIAASGLEVTRQERMAGYRLDVLRPW